MNSIEKAKLYKTAIATVSCAEFKKSEVVSVRYIHTKNGVNWYEIDKSEKGILSCIVAYPETHLTNFVL